MRAGSPARSFSRLPLDPSPKDLNDRAEMMRSTSSPEGAFLRAAKPPVSILISGFKIVRDRLEWHAFVDSLGQVDPDGPPGIVERLDSDPVLMLPVPITLERIPAHQPVKIVASFHAHPSRQ